MTERIMIIGQRAATLTLMGIKSSHENRAFGEYANGMRITRNTLMQFTCAKKIMYTKKKITQIVILTLNLFNLSSN